MKTTRGIPVCKQSTGSFTIPAGTELFYIRHHPTPGIIQCSDTPAEFRLAEDHFYIHDTLLTDIPARDSAMKVGA